MLNKANETNNTNSTNEEKILLAYRTPLMMAGYFRVIESFLARQNLHRNVAAESACFYLIPYMLTRTDLVLITGRQFMRFYEKNLPLKTFRVPIPFPAVRQSGDAV